MIASLSASASSGSRDRATSSCASVLARRLGDHAHDRFRSRRPNVHPSVRPGQPQPVLRIRLGVREGPLERSVHRVEAARSAGPACPSRSRIAGSDATISDSGLPLLQQQLQDRAAPTGASRPRCTSDRMTPPFPSPPIGASRSRIRVATFTSPTGARMTSTPGLAGDVIDHPAGREVRDDHGPFGAAAPACAASASV